MAPCTDECRSWFYAGTGRTPRPAEYWPALNRAAEALDAREVRIPWEDPATGRGGRRRVVSVRDIPRGPGRLDDVVSVVVNPDPFEAGATVLRSLAAWKT